MDDRSTVREYPVDQTPPSYRSRTGVPPRLRASVCINCTVWPHRSYSLTERESPTNLQRSFLAHGGAETRKKPRGHRKFFGIFAQSTDEYLFTRLSEQHAATEAQLPDDAFVTGRHSFLDARKLLASAP